MSWRQEHHKQVADRVSAVGLLAALIGRARKGELTASDELAIARALEHAPITLAPGADTAAQLKALAGYFLRKLWDRDLTAEEWRVVDELPRLH